MRFLSVRLILFLAWLWPGRRAAGEQEFGGDIASDAFHDGYARKQFQELVRRGIGLPSVPSLLGKRVLEIGCGHGGISVYLASIGTKEVVGADLDISVSKPGARLAKLIAEETGRELPLSFIKDDARASALPDASFDAVFADNLMEHVTDVAGTLRECARLLRPGGHMIVPVFSSWRTKWATHTKTAFNVPWLQLFFTERTIVAALRRAARKRPILQSVYPNVDTGANLREVRRFGDLNHVTFASFQDDARQAGFEVSLFKSHTTRVGSVLARLPLIRRSALVEIFSTGAGAVLRKPDIAPNNA